MISKRTVMICEDETDLLRMYVAALRKNFNVLTAESGKDCIQKYMDQSLRGRKIDLLLLDYKLGDTTGDDVACKIRDLDGTKTLLLTAYELDKDKLDDLKSRNCIAGLILKPVTMKNLVEKIEQVLT